MRTKSKRIRALPPVYGKHSIEPDTGLILAVTRLASANIHVLLQMLSRYEYACAAGNHELAEELKISIYRKMRNGR